MSEVRFVPVVEFTYADSTYLPGLSYTAGTDDLISQVYVWVDEGTVVLKDAPAKLAGVGTVT